MQKAPARQTNIRKTDKELCVFEPNIERTEDGKASKKNEQAVELQKTRGASRKFDKAYTNAVKAREESNCNQRTKRAKAIPQTCRNERPHKKGFGRSKMTLGNLRTERGSSEQEQEGGEAGKLDKNQNSDAEGTSKLCNKGHCKTKRVQICASQRSSSSKSNGHVPSSPAKNMRTPKHADGCKNTDSPKGFAA